MSLPVEAVLWVHLFVKDHKHRESKDFLDQTLEEMDTPPMNWILSKNFQITYAPVAGLVVEMPRIPLDVGDSSHYGVVLEDGRRLGLSPINGVFHIQGIQDWTFSVGDQIYKAVCEVEVLNRDIARAYREQLMKGFGFKDSSSQVENLT